MERLGVRVQPLGTSRSDLSGQDALGSAALHDPHESDGVCDFHNRNVTGLWVGHAGQPDALRVDVAYRRLPVRFGVVGSPDVHARDTRNHGIRHLGEPPAVAHCLGTPCEAAIQRHLRLASPLGPLGAGFVPAFFFKYAK